jgi:hypothetical protein
MSTPTPPPAGWYDDPQGTGRVRFWDGQEWTAQMRPPQLPAPAKPPRPLTSSFKALAAAVIALFSVAFLFELAQAWRAIRLQRWAAEVKATPDSFDIDEANLLDSLSVTFSVGALIAGLIATALFIWWSYAGHRSDRTLTKHPHWWVVGGWFIPMANLYLPFAGINDTYKGTFRKRELPPGSLTWLMSLCGVLYVTAAALSSAANTKATEVFALPGDDPYYLDLLVELSRLECVAALISAASELPVIALVVIITRALYAVPPEPIAPPAA